MFRTAVRYLFFVLGVFEFFMLYRLLIENPDTMNAELAYYPRSFFHDEATKYLSCTFTAFLGLVRIVWSMGNNSFLSWAGIVAAHTVETIFLWSLARLPHFDKSGSKDLLELVKKVQSGKVGNASANFVLFAVPVLVLLLVLHGPGSWGKRKSTKSKSQ
jgi:hypothetical protein